MAVTPATDVYAYGAVLYRLLTNRMPPGPRAHPASARNEKITPDLDDLLCQALEDGPENRFASVREMQIDLAQVLAPTTVVDPFGLPASSRFGALLSGLIQRGVQVIAFAGGLGLQTALLPIQLVGRLVQVALQGMYRVTGVAKGKLTALAALAALLIVALAILPIPMPRLPTQATDAVSHGPQREEDARELLPFPAFVPPMDSLPLDTPDPAWITVHTWPPSMVYVEDVFLLEAPAPDHHPVAPGSKTLGVSAKMVKSPPCTPSAEGYQRVKMPPWP